MKILIITLLLSLSLYADLSDIGKNYNKALKLEGKLLDKANEMLDEKTPIFQFPKIQYMRKPQDIMCQSNLGIAKSNNKHLRKELKYKNAELKRLQEENIKFKKLLKIHGIDYAHADIKASQGKKVKKMEMTITDK